MKGARVFLLTRLQESYTTPAASLNLLNDHINTAKTKLADSSNLIEKMIYTNIISQSIDFMFFISKQNHHTNSISISPLTPAEMNFDTALKREFWWQASAYKKLYGSSYIFGEEGKTPIVVSKLLFKQNMSINLAATKFSRIVNTSRLSAFEFSKYKSTAPVKVEKNYSLRNVIGNKLDYIASPDYDKYVLRIHELNNKILLFNAIVANKSESVDIINPYYQLSEKPEIKNRRLCLKSPIEDESLTGCLII